MTRAFDAIIWVIVFAAIVLILLACRPGPWRRTRSWFDIAFSRQSAPPHRPAPKEQPRAAHRPAPRVSARNRHP